MISDLKKSQRMSLTERGFYQTHLNSKNKKPFGLIGCAMNDKAYNCALDDCLMHGLWMPVEEITFTARPKINSQSQIFRYGRSIFCLPHQPKFSDFFDLCLHWASVVRGSIHLFS